MQREIWDEEVVVEVAAAWSRKKMMAQHAEKRLANFQLCRASPLASDRGPPTRGTAAPSDQPTAGAALVMLSSTNQNREPSCQLPTPVPSVREEFCASPFHASGIRGSRF